MHSKNKLGYANLKTGYYSYYQSLLPHVHKGNCNAFWSMSILSLQTKRIIFDYRTGKLLNQKHAVCFTKSTSLQCPLCYHADSALHFLLRDGLSYGLEKDKNYTLTQKLHPYTRRTTWLLQLSICLRLSWLVVVESGSLHQSTV